MFFAKTFLFRTNFLFAQILDDYVGFYYMLVYGNSKIKKEFSKEFLSTLHGKTCFYIRDIKPTTIKEVKKALKIGVKEYKKRSWL